MFYLYEEKEKRLSLSVRNAIGEKNPLGLVDEVDFFRNVTKERVRSTVSYQQSRGE